MGKDGTYYKPQERILWFWVGLKHYSSLGSFRGMYCYDTIEKAQNAIQEYHVRIKFRSNIVENIELND